MYNKALNTVRKYNMLRSGDSVIVGLSGGADSCALLLFLCALREETDLSVYACHINHLLRGDEAFRDEHFAEELCRKMNVPLFVLRKDIKAEATLRRTGTEQCGREVRYEFFEQKARELSAKIATAHTASDNAETVLFNLTRGSGIAGLCGIPPVRGNIIRPLIECGREEIEAYCASRATAFVTDSTNLTREYTRNKIRLDVIPVLKGINPNAEAAICGMSERLREAQAYIGSQARKALDGAAVSGGYSMKLLSELDAPVFSAAVRILCKKYALIPEAKHIELMRKIVYNGGVLEISAGIYAAGSQGVFRITRYEHGEDNIIVPFDAEKELVFGKRKYLLTVVGRDEYEKIGKKRFFGLLDYDTIPLTSVFRTRQSGDSFAPNGRKITKSVKKLFIELKIPREERSSVLMLADGSRVLWIDGVGAAESCAVKGTTKRILMISEN